MKRDLWRSNLRLLERFPVHTAAGVIACLSSYHELVEEAHRGNYDVTDMLVDLEAAFRESFLSIGEIIVLSLVFIGDRGIDDTAAQLGTTPESVSDVVQSAAAKLARYLGGTEGYGDS